MTPAVCPTARRLAGMWLVASLAGCSDTALLLVDWQLVDGVVGNVDSLEVVMIADPECGQPFSGGDPIGTIKPSGDNAGIDIPGTRQGDAVRIEAIGSLADGTELRACECMLLPKADSSANVLLMFMPGAPPRCGGSDDTTTDCTGATDCGDGDGCTEDGCARRYAACWNQATEGSCDDGNPCTINDSCASGTCRGTADPGRSCGDLGSACEGSCDDQGACLGAGNATTCGGMGSCAGRCDGVGGCAFPDVSTNCGSGECDGRCDGSGGCELAPLGTVCGTGTCGGSCNGAGVCAYADTDVLCNGSGDCAAACDGAGNCDTFPNGTACGDSECGGSCDGAGSCGYADTSTPCGTGLCGGTCDGIGACGFASATTPCSGSGDCAATCDGNGTCGAFPGAAAVCGTDDCSGACDGSGSCDSASSTCGSVGELECNGAGTCTAAGDCSNSGPTVNCGANSDCSGGECDAFGFCVDPGPFTGGAEINAGWVGGTCSDVGDCDSTAYSQSPACLTADFPGGMCTQACDDYGAFFGCPDDSTPGYGLTRCIRTQPDGAPAPGGYCVAQCDFSLSPATGCRPGYECVMRIRYRGPTDTTGAPRLYPVCLPAAWGRWPGELCKSGADIGTVPTVPGPDGFLDDNCEHNFRIECGGTGAFCTKVMCNLTGCPDGSTCELGVPASIYEGACLPDSSSINPNTCSTPNGYTAGEDYNMTGAGDPGDLPTGTMWPPR